MKINIYLLQLKIYKMKYAQQLKNLILPNVILYFVFI